MGVVHLADGTVARLAARHGSTADDLAKSLSATSLTGSARPAADADIDLDDGRTIPYESVIAFEFGETL